MGATHPVPLPSSSGGTITPHETATVGPGDPLSHHPPSARPPSPHRDSQGAHPQQPELLSHRGAPAPCTMPAPWLRTRLLGEQAESRAVTLPLPQGPAHLPAGWESSSGSPPHQGDRRAASSSASTGMIGLKPLLHSPRCGIEGHKLKHHENQQGKTPFIGCANCPQQSCGETCF